ncbi:MAG: hypothetical protein QE487_08895 [Fluviicola sp.]|nr:hypothetical protein [Fluviicola sp.]
MKTFQTIITFLLIHWGISCQETRNELRFVIDYYPFPPVCSVCSPDEKSGECNEVYLQKGTYLIDESEVTVVIGENGKPNGSCVKKDMLMEITYNIENGSLKSYSTVNNMMPEKLYVSELIDSTIITNSFIGKTKVSTSKNYLWSPGQPKLLIEYNASGKPKTIEQIIGYNTLKLYYQNEQLYKVEQLEDLTEVILTMTIDYQSEKPTYKTVDADGKIIEKGDYNLAKLTTLFPDIFLDR